MCMSFCSLNQKKPRFPRNPACHSNPRCPANPSSLEREVPPRRTTTADQVSAASLLLCPLSGPEASAIGTKLTGDGDSKAQATEPISQVKASGQMNPGQKNFLFACLSWTRILCQDRKGEKLTERYCFWVVCVVFNVVVTIISVRVLLWQGIARCSDTCNTGE